MHERIGRGCATRANFPAHDQFSVGAKSGPRPNIAESELALLVGGNIFFFGVAERPDFIALDFLAWEITQRLIVEPLTGRPKHSHKALDGVFGHPGHAHDRSDGIAFD